MYYMDDEDYFGPSEFDAKIEELKNELRKSVKKEVKDELEKLREENKKLQGIKEDFESIKEDLTTTLALQRVRGRRKKGRW